MAIGNLLSISGGGLYGHGPVEFLSKFHPQTQIDYVAGTSVGSIIAAMIGKGLSFKVIQSYFQGDLPKKIFTKPTWPSSWNPLRSATYDNVEAIKALKVVFGEMKMKDLPRPTIIVAWTLNKKTPKVFTHKHNNEYKVWEAILCSMSAPTYFPEYKIGNDIMVDGGVCANEPSLAGIAAMREDNYVTKDIRCLMLTTTGRPHPKNYSISGVTSWINPLIEVLTLGNAEYSTYITKAILGENAFLVSPENLPQGNLDDFSIVKPIRDVWNKLDAQPAMNFLAGNPPKI